MADFLESESFVLPSQVREDVAGRLQDPKSVKSLELLVKGEALEGAKAFGDLLLTLRKRGVRISHEFLIKLDFPKSISRDKTLSLVESMPKPRNGSLKVRIQLDDVNKESPLTA